MGSKKYPSNPNRLLVAKFSLFFVGYFYFGVFVLASVFYPNKFLVICVSCLLAYYYGKRFFTNMRNYHESSEDQARRFGMELLSVAEDARETREYGLDVIRQTKGLK